METTARINTEADKALADALAEGAQNQLATLGARVARAAWLGWLQGLIVGLAVGAALAYGASVHGEEPPATVRGSLGYSGVFSERADTVPTALVEFESPIPMGNGSMGRVLAQLKALGVKGDKKFSIGDVATYGSAEFDLFLRLRIGSDREGGSTFFYVHGGGAALRDSHGDAPFQANPVWYSVGITLERRELKKFPSRWVSIGLGHSDISSPPLHAPGTLAQAARDAKPRDLIVSGSAVVRGPSKSQMIISGDVHRGIYGPRATTQVRLSTTVTWGD